jgi:hypothetical protein
VRALIDQKKLRYVGKYHVQSGERESYPVPHYARVK